MAAEENELDPGAVEAGLAGTMFAGRLHHLRATDSTNTLALAAAQAGATAGVWLADEQTAGRGRGGHRWHSAAGDGLYVSALLRPRLYGVDALKLSLAAGLACRTAVAEAAGIAIDLRWPNDLMETLPNGPGGAQTQRKFGGILTETAMQGGEGRLAYAVIGMGMNLNHAELPEELRESATSLRLMGGERVSRERILPALLRALLVEVERVEAEAAGAVEDPLALRFERASTWVRGLRVHVAEDDGYTGVTDGLHVHGLLRVRLETGELRTVRHGGVRRA